MASCDAALAGMGKHCILYSHHTPVLLTKSHCCFKKLSWHSEVFLHAMWHLVRYYPTCGLLCLRRFASETARLMRRPCFPVLAGSASLAGR